MLLKLTVAACLWLSVCGVAHAQVYKWVDEHGKIHYGDRPPEEERASKLAVRKSPSAPAQPASPEQPIALPPAPGATPKHHTIEPAKGSPDLKQ
jgi:hypothetical protein